MRGSTPLGQDVTMIDEGSTDGGKGHLITSWGVVTSAVIPWGWGQETQGVGDKGRSTRLLPLRIGGYLGLNVKFMMHLSPYQPIYTLLNLL